MTWLKRAQEVLRSIVLGPYNAKDPALARLFGAVGTSSGMAVNEYTALNISAVWCGVVVIAGGIAALPLDLMRRKTSGRNDKERYVEHPTYELVHARPNDEMSSTVFRRTLQASALLWGNGYAEIERDGAGRPLALWPLAPDRVYPYREPTGELVYRVTHEQRDRGLMFAEVAPENMLHIPGLGWDGICGYSVVSRAREALGLSVATERFGAQFFGNGANMSGVLSHPKMLSPTARKNIEESLDENHARGKARRSLVLEEGMTWTAMGVPPDDGQFLETRKFQVTEIARWLNLPPHKLKDLERATFSNIEQQSIEFVQESLLPWLVCWEQELDRKLIRPLERRQQFFKHNVNGLLRGDTASRYSAYAVGRQWGWLSANDVRDLEDMNSIGAQGDIYLMPGNMLDANGPMPTPGSNAPQPPDAAPPDDQAPARHAEVQGQLAALTLRLDALRTEPGVTPDMLTTAQADLVALIRSAGEERVESAAAAAERDAKQADAVASLREAFDAIKPPELPPALLADTAAILGSVERQEEAIAALRAAPPPAEPVAALTAEQGAAILAALEALRAEVQVRPLPPQESEPRPAMPEPEPPAAARATARLIAGQRAALLDAAGRLVRREIGKIRTAKSPEKLRPVMREFYGKKASVFEAMLLPAIQAHLGIIGSDQDAGTVTRHLVAEHIEHSRTQLHALLDEVPADWPTALRALLLRWEIDRPAALADALIEEEMVYAHRD